MDIVIRNEKEIEYRYVETMTRASFWNVYKPGCDEHVMVHKLRQSKEYIPELDFVAEYDGKIVGHVMCSHTKILNEQDTVVDEENIVAIGPICVLPKYQGLGIGSALMNHVILETSRLGYLGLVLYGNPTYYHRFGFVNAKEYGISTPQNENFEEFMMLGLEERVNQMQSENRSKGYCSDQRTLKQTQGEKQELAENQVQAKNHEQKEGCKRSESSKLRLVQIKGRCYESSAFEVSQEELITFEQTFIGKMTCSNQGSEPMDVYRVKQEFEQVQVKFPLHSDECIGLSQDERNIINPCGTYCGDCEDYGVVCDGCRNREGKPIWYHLYGKEETCSHYSCTKGKNYHDCSQCKQLPCQKFFEYPDPNMSDEIKQYWFKLRMENFNQINCTNIIKVEETYAENEKVYAMEVGSTTENEKAYGTEENSTTETDMNDCVEKSTTKEE